MRLNEKSLIEFASSKDAVDKEGILYKKGELNRGFQKRWFVLKGNLLFYFDKRGDKQPLGVIILEDCNVEVCDTADKYSFSISFSSGTSPRTYILGADNEKVMENWMKAVTLAPYDYTRTVVRELQKRVNKLRTNDLQMAKKDEESSQDDFLGSYNSLENVSSAETEEDTCTGTSQFSDTVNIPKLASTSDLRQSKQSARHSEHIFDTRNATNLMVPESGSRFRKSLPTLVRRTKSSENLHQINQQASKGNSRSPLFRRKGAKEYQSVKRHMVHTKSSSENDNLDILDNQHGLSQFSTFQVLHEQFSVGIWTKVKCYEDAQAPKI